MRLHFQGNPQTERQRGLPHGGKLPRRKAEFQDTPSTNCSTSSRSHSLVSVPSHQQSVPWQKIHLKPKRDWPAANGSLWTSKWREQPARSTLGTAEVPLVPLRSHSFLWGPTRSSYLLMPKEKPEQTHSKHRPHGTKRLIPQISDIFPGKMMMWEGRKLVFTRKLQPSRICPSPVAHKGFFTCLTFREDTGVGCQQLPDSDKQN